MSEGQFSKTTRRSFLGTATVATAATLAVPVGGAAHSGSTGNSTGLTKVAAVNNANENLVAAAKASDWTKPAEMAIPKEGYLGLSRDDTVHFFPRRRQITASRSLQRLNQAVKKRSVSMERP